MECIVHVADSRLVEANAADFPLQAPRFVITKKSDSTLHISADDTTALRAASNALFTILSVAHKVKRIQ